MPQQGGIRHRLNRLMGRLSTRDEVDSEFAFHVEMRTRELTLQGMDTESARCAAIRRFGDMDRVSRECRKIARERNRRMHWKEWLDELRQDLLFAFRQARGSFSLTALVVLTLGLGIGANTAVFSIVDAVILRPLPIPEPERAVRIWEITPQGDRFSTSDANFLDFRERNRSFSDLAVLSFPAPQLTLLGDGEPENLNGQACTGSLFRVLGVEPLLGRTFSPQEEEPGRQSRVIVLSQQLWQRRFGADPLVVGRTLNLDNEKWTVIGVIPENFDFLVSPDVWVPYAPDPGFPRGDHRLEMFGRLKPGVSLRKAREDLQSIAAQLGAEYPESNRDWGVEAISFPDWIIGSDVRQATLILQCSVGLMLLLACANVSNLLIARATARQKEIGLRAALGAGRFRIVRQLLTESVFLAGLGAGAGLLLANWCIPVLGRLNPEALPRIEEVALDTKVFAFALAVSLGVGILAGIAPALQISRDNLSDVLRAGRQSSTFGARRLRDSLVVGELALAMMLLIAAGLLVKSFRELTGVHPGFEAEGVLAISLSLPESRYSQMSPQTRDLYRQLLERIEAVPGVDSAGASIVDPFRGPRPSNQVGTEQAQEKREFVWVQWRSVTEGFFRSMGVGLIRGRVFDRSDRVYDDSQERAVPVVISATLAQRLWGDGDPVGKRVQWNRPGGSLFEVVGVVADMRDINLGDNPPPMIYLNHETIPWPAMTILVKTSLEPSALAGTLREAIWAVDKDLPVPEIWPLEQNLSEALAGSRLNSQLMATFAAIALLMACLGIYGIMSYTVARRGREIGVRMAMGALPRNMVGLVLKHGLKLLAAGTILGLAGAFGLTRFLSSMLYQTSPTHMATFAILAITLAIAGTFASLLPALKAARVDPVRPLKSE